MTVRHVHNTQLMLRDKKPAFNDVMHAASELQCTVIHKIQQTQAHSANWSSMQLVTTCHCYPVDRYDVMNTR